MVAKTQYLNQKLQKGEINWPGNVSNSQWDGGECTTMLNQNTTPHTEVINLVL